MELHNLIMKAQTQSPITLPLLEGMLDAAEDFDAFSWYRFSGEGLKITGEGSGVKG